MELADVTTVRIHPAIGIARLGNSPDGYFLGPELPGSPPVPDDGRYKDAQGRVKRQAARFRCYGFNAASDEWIELTASAQVTVEWTVHLVNRKPAAKFARKEQLRNPSVTGTAREGLVINPGPRTLKAPGQRAAFDTGKVRFGTTLTTVGLGEIRTETDGRLLVLGGPGTARSPQNTPLKDYFDNDGWYDDTADGPVTATVSINGRAIAAKRAWVVVAPPKYAPELDHPVTLWDRLHALYYGTSRVPPRPSYTQDVYPILDRARRMWAVNKEANGWHGRWGEPVYGDAMRRKIFHWLRKPPGPGEKVDKTKMPKLAGDGSLTDAHLTVAQYETMRRWWQGEFVRDWPGHPPETPRMVTPGGLDRAVLEACVGATFTPGMEAGRYWLDKAVWAEPLRFATSVRPGEVTARMALPWHADFYSCDNNWWPVARPNQVLSAEGTGYAEWIRGIATLTQMVNNWHHLGFVRRESEQRIVERERTEPPRLREHKVTAGTLAAGQHASWPVWVTREDRRITVRIHTPDPAALAVEVETPLAVRITPQPERTSDGLVFRIELPVELHTQRQAHQGRWLVHLTATAPTRYRVDSQP